MKNYCYRIVKLFLCVGMLLNICTYNYAYESDFFDKTNDEFINYIQNDLTYFGETFFVQDYNTLLDVYNLFENDLRDPRYYPFDINAFKQKLVDRDNFMDYVLLTGDSYSGNLNNCFVKYYNYKNSLLQNAGHTILENVALYKSAIYSKHPIIVISTSVNDVLRQTAPYVFKRTVEDLFDSARLNDKILIVHTNCNFFVNGISANASDLFRNRPKLYDEIIKISAKKYENVIYVDCRDIATREYLSSDDIHYNEKFHFQLAKKIYDAISELAYVK